MTVGRELFERALDGEPPLGLDVAALERAEARRARRLRFAVPLAAASVAAVVIGGGVALTGGFGTLGGGPASAGSQPVPGTAPPGNPEAGYCYRTADIGSREVNQHLLFGIAGDGPDGRGDITGEIMSICADAWKNNHAGWNKASPTIEGSAHPVPALVACVLDGRAVDAMEGAVAVFPGGPDTCAGLGLPVADLG